MNEGVFVYIGLDDDVRSRGAVVQSFRSFNKKPPLRNSTDVIRVASQRRQSFRLENELDGCATFSSRQLRDSIGNRYKL